MYDIKIFLEDNGQFGAVASLGREKIYALGSSQQELIRELREGIAIVGQKTEKSQKLANFLV